MRKTLALVAALSGLAAAAPAADLFKVAVDGGYTTLNMADVNDALAKAANSTPIKSGWFIGAEAGMSLMPFLELGPRVEYLSSNKYEVKNGAGDVQDSGVASLTSLMVGANVKIDLPLTGLGLGIGAFGGYGMANATSDGPASSPKATKMTGGAFVGELEAKLGYKIFPLTSFDLMAGMRLANVGKLKDDAGKDTVVFDYTGLNLGAGLTIGF